MQYRLASEILRVPAYGYMQPVHIDRLPWARATNIVESANDARTHFRELDTPSWVSPMEIALCAGFLYYGLEPGVDFDAQVPVGRFDADFLFYDDERVGVGLVVEVDGKAFHNFKRDHVRDSIMERDGYRVLRFGGRSVYRDPLQCARETQKRLKVAVAA